MEKNIPENLLSRARLVSQLLKSRKARDAYVYEHVRNGIPFQIRALRKHREWSQSQLAEEADTSRTVITRIEDPNYGSLTLKTLYQIASAFDVALLVKFVPFSRLVREYEDVSHAALSAQSVSDEAEAEALEAWATEQPANETVAAVRVLSQGGKTALFAAAALRQSQTPVRYLRMIDSPTVTTAAVQRSLAFSSPVALTVESAKVSTASQPMGVTQTKPSNYAAA